MGGRPLILVVLCAFSLARSSVAQTPVPAGEPGNTSPFRQLDLPTPNQYRTGSGRPGAGYWQQRADYTISATLDTASRQIRGRETIHYTNHSPEALPYIWMFVE